MSSGVQITGRDILTETGGACGHAGSPVGGAWSPAVLLQTKGVE